MLLICRPQKEISQRKPEERCSEKKEKKQRKVSRMNSLPLYPISMFAMDCTILLSTGSLQISGSTEPTVFVVALALAALRMLGRAPAQPAPGSKCLPLTGTPQLQYLLLFVLGSVSLGLCVHVFAV